MAKENLVTNVLEEDKEPCIWRPIKEKDETRIEEGEEPMLDKNNDVYNKCYRCDGTKKGAEEVGCGRYQTAADLAKTNIKVSGNYAQFKE